jgi:cell division protein FtsB
MDQEDLPLFTWGMEVGAPMQHPFQLSHSIEYDEPLNSIPVPSSAPATADNALADSSAALPESSFERHSPSAPHNSGAGTSHLAPVPRVPNSRCEAAVPLSESSTHPGDVSDAVTSASPYHDTRITSVSTADKASSPKRRRTSKIEELSFFDDELLQDLKGTTAARSRLMSEEERNLMLHKRRLRNRASAARSREKQRSAVQCLSQQAEGLISTIHDLRKDCAAQHAEIRRLREQNNALRAAISLRSNLPGA